MSQSSLSPIEDLAIATGSKMAIRPLFSDIRAAYARKMKRVAWVGIGAGLALAVFGFVAGTVIDFREDAAPTTAADVCSPVPANGVKALNLAIGSRRIDLTFDSPSWITGLRGPLNGLTIIRAEVDGPEFEAEGDVSIWALGPGHRTGTYAGVSIYALNPVARRVDGRSTDPGKYLRNIVEDGEAVYDPRVIRAIAPAVAASCMD